MLIFIKMGVIMFKIQWGESSTYGWSQSVVEEKLEAISLIENKKTSWIRSELDTKKSSLLSRIIWTFLAKHFNCLRERFYGVNLDKSESMLLQIGKQIDKNNSKLVKTYNLAIEKFNSIAPHHVVPTITPAPLKKSLSNIPPEVVKLIATPKVVLPPKPTQPVSTDEANEFLAKTIEQGSVLTIEDLFSFQNATKLDLRTAKYPLSKDSLELIFSHCPYLMDIMLPPKLENDGSSWHTPIHMMDSELNAVETLRFCIKYKSEKAVVRFKFAPHSNDLFVSLLTNMATDEGKILFKQMHEDDLTQWAAVLSEAINLSEDDIGNSTPYLYTFLQEIYTSEIETLLPVLRNLPAKHRTLYGAPFKKLTVGDFPTLLKGMEQADADLFRDLIFSGFSDNGIILKNNFIKTAKAIFNAFAADKDLFQKLCKSVKSLQTGRGNGMQILLKGIVQSDLDLNHQFQLLDVFFNLNDKEEYNDAKLLSNVSDPLKLRTVIHEITQILKETKDSALKGYGIYKKLTELEHLDRDAITYALVKYCPISSIPLIFEAFTNQFDYGNNANLMAVSFIREVLQTNNPDVIHQLFQSFWPIEHQLMGHYPKRLKGILKAIDSKMKLEAALKALPDDISKTDRAFYISSLCIPLFDGVGEELAIIKISLPKEDIIGVLKEQKGPNKAVIDELGIIGKIF